MAERICDAKYTFFGELCKKSLRLLALVFLSLTAMMTFAQQSNYLNRTNPKGEKFTEAQIKSLRERLKQAGCRFGSYNGHNYWWTQIKSQETANSISERTKIPIDTLYMLAEIGARDQLISQYKEDAYKNIETYDKILNDFFTHPNDITGASNYILAFPNEPNIIVPILKTKEEQIFDNLVFSDNLKTYTGEFEMTGFAFGPANIVSLVGTANYQYKDAPDGSRIFEGKFSFDQGDTGRKAKAAGFFINDKQVGKWTWDYPIRNDAYDRDIDFHCEIIFNENGIPDGDFDIYIGKVSKTNGAYKRSYYSGTFKNGKLVSVRFKDRNLIWCQGQYGLNGKPQGTWRMGEEGSHNITITYDDYGNVKKSGYRDDSTGDWIVATSDYPNKLYSQVVEMIRWGYCFRSTSF